MKKKKGFDAVGFQRQRRKEISEEYRRDPEGYIAELRRKYPVKENQDPQKETEMENSK